MLFTVRMYTQACLTDPLRTAGNQRTVVSAVGSICRVEHYSFLKKMVILLREEALELTACLRTFRV
jgi:hypothetical protein